MRLTLTLLTQIFSLSEQSTILPTSPFIESGSLSMKRRCSVANFSSLIRVPVDCTESSRDCNDVLRF